MSQAPKSKLSPRELAKHFVGFQQNAVPLVPEGAVISAAELPALKSNEIPTYRQVKSNFKTDLKSRDLRFRLSDQVASQLSVEEEEEERFQKRVEEELEARLNIVKAEAHNKGFAQGQGEGKAQAFEEEKIRIAKMLESVAILIKNIEEAKEKLAEDYEEQLLQVSVRIAEVVLQKEIKERPESIAFTIKAILNRIAKEDDVRIRLPSGVYETFEAIKKEVADGPRSGRIQFELDPGLKEGSCVVESLSGEISANIQESLEKLKADLLNQSQTKIQETGT